jgi:hypothetical protein
LQLVNRFYNVAEQKTGNIYYLIFFKICQIILLLFGAHRRVVAPTILVQRTREVLYDFAMDCDDTGKLIYKPRPATA